MIREKKNKGEIIYFFFFKAYSCSSKDDGLRGKTNR